MRVWSRIIPRMADLAQINAPAAVEWPRPFALSPILKRTNRMEALPGSDYTSYRQCNPNW
jgi:hypothetical protein